MNVKPYWIILAGSFGLMILGAFIGGILESSGTVTRETLGSKRVATIKLIYFALFCLASFALVPVVLRVFLTMHNAVGNAEFFPISWIRANERTVVYCFWGLCMLGLVSAFTLCRKQILKSFK